MLVSIILNLNMTGSVTPVGGTVLQNTHGGTPQAMPYYDYNKERKIRVENEDAEVLFLIETIMKECL